MRLWVPLVMVLGVSACAGVAPMPGGSETVNAAYYSTANDFKDKVAQLQAGMPESLVLGILGRSADDMTRLSRYDLVTALYGPNTMHMLDTAQELEQTHVYLQSLYGYKLEYRDVKKSLGFESPIRVRTEEKGFSYSVNLIFQNGTLIEKPAITGGVVNESTSKTFFDYFNPGTVLDRAGA